jgi:hypothetical protein
MAIIHFAITVVLSVLVVWVRCYCKRRECTVVVPSKDDPKSVTAGNGVGITVAVRD